MWRAWDRDSRTEVTVRLTQLGRSAEPRLVNELRRERETLASIRHPALLSIRDIVVERGRIGLVTDLVEGQDLRRHLVSAGPIAPATATSMAADLADALAAAHARGIFHTHVTSVNVIVGTVDGRVRLTDLATPKFTRRFGRVTPATEAPAYEAPPYAAPELIRGERWSAPSDIYALGIVLYEMLTGATPYAGGSTREVLRRHLQAEPVWPPGTPSGLRFVLSRCLQHDPAARPSATAVAADLREISTHLGGIPAAPRPSPGTVRYREAGRQEEPPEPTTTEDPIPATATQQRSRDWLTQQAVPIAAAGLALLTVMAGLATALTGALRDDDERDTANPASATASPSRPPARSSRQPAQTVSTTPTLPATGAQRTPGGATAFVAYWFESLTYATRTGNVAHLTAASSPSCIACQNAATTVRQAYTAGGSFRGGVYLVRSTISSGFPAGTQPAVDVVFDRSPRSSVNAKGDVRGNLPGASFVVCRVQLEWAGERWRMLNVETPGGPIA